MLPSLASGLVSLSHRLSTMLTVGCHGCRRPPRRDGASGIRTAHSASPDDRPVPATGCSLISLAIPEIGEVTASSFTSPVTGTASGQSLLFGAQEMHDPAYYSRLRSLYTDRAKRAVQETLMRQLVLGYDDAWCLSMEHPLVWERDLKDWIAAWRREGRLSIHGLSPRKEPSRRTGISLKWS